MHEHGSLGRACAARVVMDRDRVEQLGGRVGFLQQPQAEVDVSQQSTLLGRCKGRRRTQLARSPDVVDERRREQQISSEPRVELRDLAADRGDADRVLEQAAGVRVVALERRRVLRERRIGKHARRARAQAVVRDLAEQELEEALELVGVSPHCRRERCRVGIRGLERADLELKPVAELLDPPEDADRVPGVEPPLEELDVVPDACRDPARGVGELERKVRRAAAGAEPFFSRHRVDAVDDAVLDELRDRRHDDRVYGLDRVAPVPVRSFRAEHYSDAAGLLDELVAPPYDVVDDALRDDLLSRSPYNIAHLTLSESGDEAAQALRAWREFGVLEQDPDAASWVLSQTYVGPDGVERTRNGVVVALRLAPYADGIVLPHERTHAGPKEGRLRILRATRTQLEPIFLLHEGPRVDVPARAPNVATGGDRLWRIDDAPDLGDRQLLIADGHHRYETALAFHEEDATEASAWMMVVLVSTAEDGLTIFPTHRLAQSINGAKGRPIDAPGDELPGLVLYRDGRYELLEGDGLDVEVVDRLAPSGVTYTPQREDAVAAVDRGEAAAAFLLRPTPLEAVFDRARRGEVMPQKTTYFFPKLTSGLLLYPLD